MTRAASVAVVKLINSPSRHTANYPICMSPQRENLHSNSLHRFDCASDSKLGTTFHVKIYLIFMWRLMQNSFTKFVVRRRLSLFISASIILGSSFPVLTTCSVSSGKGTNSDSHNWDDLRPKMIHAARKASDFYAPVYKLKVQKLLHPIEELSFRSIPLTLIEDCSTALKLCLAVYSKIVDGIPLSTGHDDLPDCVARYDDLTKTLWIISRGTQTTDDVMSDITWLMSTEKIGHLDIPSGVVARCREITPRLLEHLAVLKMQKNDVKKIVFTGHSLGGSISIGLYLSWHLNKSVIDGRSKYGDQIETSVISIGAPLVISNPPEGYRANHFSTSQDDKESFSVSEHARNVHNIVMGLDIVPRILGNHFLPDYMSEATTAMGFGDLNQKLKSSYVHRETYKPFGNFYSLREKEDQIDKGFLNILNIGNHESAYNNNNEPFLLGRVLDPRTFLSCFPDNVADLAYSVHRDHNLIEATKAVDAALKRAKELHRR